jgi:hypothetical protein
MIELRRDDGMAIVITLLALLLMSALGASLVMITSSETMIAANFAASIEALYAADGAAERAAGELSGTADWNAVLAGTIRSSFADGPASGSRTTADGSTIDLDEVVDLANCGKRRPCSSAEMDAATSERPWGANNPRWQLYAYGPLRGLAGSVDSTCYVVVLVGDDPWENDGNPLQDGAGTGNPGSGVIAIRAEARGARGARKVVELTIARRNGPQLLSWREIR